VCGGVAAFCQKDQAPASLAQAAPVKQTEDQQARPQPQSPATASARGGDQTGDRASSGSASDAAALPDLTPDAKGALSQEQMQRLFRVVAAKDLENDKLLRNYTYIEREVQNKLDGKGQTKSTEVKTYEVLEVYGEQINRLIEKDDKPLPEKDAAKEEKKIQKIIDKRKNESEGERKKREEKDEKDSEEGRKFVREIADAYNFKLVGTEW